MTKSSIFAISDLHIGDRRFLYNSFLSTLSNLKKDPDVIVICGDLVAGRGVYHDQELHSIIVPYQVAAATAILGDLRNSFPGTRIILISGNHDRGGDGSDLTELTYRYARSEGIPAEYSGTEAILSVGKTNIFFHHGFGYSRFSPHAPAYLSHITLKYLTLLERGIRIHRFCHGHTHWLSHSMFFSNFIVDSLGGFQAFMKATECLSPMSPPGGLLYEPEGVSVVLPNEKDLKRELRSNLEERNHRLYAKLCHSLGVSPRVI